MADATMTTFAAALKRLYPDDHVEKLMYDNNPCFAMMAKKYDFGGESMQLALQIAHTSGRSALFSTAKQNKAASNIVKLLVTTVEDYSLFSISGKLIASATGNKTSLVNAMTQEMDAGMEAMNRSFGTTVFSNGGGAVGQITTGGSLAVATATLSPIDDVVNFEVGDYISFATTDGTSGSVISGRLRLSGVNRDTGVLTFDANLSTIAGLATATAYYLFHEGDFGARMKGIGAWIPGTAPSGGDSFFGLDRSVDTSRLAGVRVQSVAGASISEVVKKGLQQGFRNGAKTSHIFMNDKRFLDFELELQGQRRYVDTSVADVGFTGIQVPGHNGKLVEVYGDPNCPVNTIFGLEMKGWSIEGPQKFPSIVTADGNKLLREESADSYEGRIVSYHQMICRKPGANWRADL